MSRQEKLAALASTGVTKAELDNIDGGTARGTTAIADGDGVLINDAGTMRMTSVETMATYIGTKVGGGMEFIASSGAMSDAANAAFTGFDSSKYDHYIFYFQHVVPALNNKLLLGRIAVSGTSYDTTSGNYHSNINTDRTGMVLAEFVGSDSNEFGASGAFNLYSPHTAAYTYGFSEIIFIDSSGNLHAEEMGAHARSVHLNAASVTAIQFLYNEGNIESGEITMFGIVNS